MCTEMVSNLLAVRGLRRFFRIPSLRRMSLHFAMNSARHVREATSFGRLPKSLQLVADLSPDDDKHSLICFRT
jgi:hypothetical protein